MIEQVVVVRHAEREDTVNKEWAASNALSYDTPLSAHGFEQAEALASDLSGMCIAQKLGCKLRVAVVFGEWMNPDYFDLSVPPADNHTSITASSYNWVVREARSAVQYLDFAYDTRALGLPGSYGETWEEMHARAIRGIDTAIASEHNSVVIVVTHGSLCNSILGHLRRVPEMRRISQASWEAVKVTH